MEKSVEHEGDGYINCNLCSWYNHQMIGAESGGLAYKRSSWDHQNYRIIEISQNTEKSTGDLKGLAVTQTRVRNHRLTQVEKKTLSNHNNSKDGLKKPENVDELEKNLLKLKSKENLIVRALHFASHVTGTVR